MNLPHPAAASAIKPVRTEHDGLGAAVRGLWDAAKRRWKVFAAVTLAIFVAVLVGVMLITPKFQATVRLRVEPTQNALIGQNVGSSLPDQSIVETEASVMRSHDIAEEVVRRLNLTADREFTANIDDPAADGGEAAKADWHDKVVDEVSSRVSAVREKSTYVVDLGFQSVDPVKAAKIANEFAAVYIESSVGRRTGTAARQSTMLRGRIKALTQEAAQADAQLAQYRATTGIVQTGERSVNDQQIASLAGQVSTAESDAAAARSKLTIARSQIANGGITAVSAVLSSNVISNLRAQRAQLVTQQGEIATRYGPRHPETLRVTQQIDSIDRQIQEEAARVIGGLQSEASSASARAASLRGDFERLRGAQANETRSSAAAVSIQRKADAANEALRQANDLAQRTDQIEASSLSQAQIIEAAAPPKAPTAPNKKLLLAAGLAFALCAGGSAIAGQELLASGLRTRADVERLGLPLLAAVPRLSKKELDKGNGPRNSPADTLLAAPVSVYAEAFRTIRSALTIGVDRHLQVIAPVSSLPGEGKTTTSLSLARMFAISGERTLVIDADIRRAGLGNLLSQAPAVGLVEVLRDGVAVERAIQPDQVPGLDVLTVASASFVADDLFSGPAMRDLIATLRKRYDRIVLDTPPLLGVADARTLAAAADAVLLIVHWQRTSSAAVQNALKVLDLDKAPLAGVVLTQVDPRAEVAGALYYSSRYSSYYQTV